MTTRATPADPDAGLHASRADPAIVSDGVLVDIIERLFVAAIGLTTRALSEATPGLDLTFPQWRVLLILGERSNGATVSEVALRVGVTVPATSRQLRRLAERDLVSISPDDDDRRATRATLSVSGRQARDAILSYRRSRIESLAAEARVSPRTIRELDRLAGGFDLFR